MTKKRFVLLMTLFLVVLSVVGTKFITPLHAATSSLTIDANTVVQTVTPIQFGVNTMAVCNMNTPVYINAAREMGVKEFRFPGGNEADAWHWKTNYNEIRKDYPPTSWTEFLKFYQAVGGTQLSLEVNYGTGTYQEAADWVQDAKNRGLNVKYWEIGNEIWLGDETDYHGKTTPLGLTLPGKDHDPTTYGTEAANFIKAMKAVDPNIKCGVHVLPWEGNPWDAPLFNAMKAQGVMPDFVIHHTYPGGNEDYRALTDAARMGTKWYADNCRKELANVWGSAASGVEFHINEINSSCNVPYRRQTTSLVGGLFLAKVCGISLYNGIHNITWFQFNQTNTGVIFADSLSDAYSQYGWRKYINPSSGVMDTYGDLAMMQAVTNDKYPEFYTAKLFQKFARSGDQVLAVTNSDTATDPYLTHYALKGSDGSLRIMVVNASATDSYTSTINLTGFTAPGPATILTYGKSNDDAASTGSGERDLTKSTTTISGTSFTRTYDPYSVTVIILGGSQPSITGPSAPTLSSNGKTSTSVRLSWTSVSGADHYDVYFRKPVSSNSFESMFDSLSGTSCEVLGLRANTNYTFRIRAMDANGNPSGYSNEVSVTTDSPGPSTPYSGTAYSLNTSTTTKIEAEDFDKGGESSAYHDYDTGNTGGVYRPYDDVDMQACTAGGYNLGWIKAGEWLQYSVNVATAGTYKMTFNVASNGSGGQFHVEFGGANKTGSVTISDTGSWQTYSDITVDGLILSAGAQYMRIVFDKDASGGTTGYLGNLNYMTITGGTPVTPTPSPSPVTPGPYTRIEAEAFDSQSGVQTETSTEFGQNVGFIENGDWTAYNNVNFGSPGAKTFEARVASNSSGGSIEVRLDSTTGTLVGTCSVSGTGGWQAWQTASCSVSGATGNHTLYLVFKGGSGYLFNLNWFRFTTDGSTPTPVVTSTPTNTPTPTPTTAPPSGATNTPTKTPTNTPTTTTNTATPTSTSTATPTPTVTVPPPTGGTNLIANPGFESGNANWMGTSWGYVAGNQHSGSNAVRIGTGSGSWCSQDVTTGVVVGATYTFSAWVKCDLGQNIDISVQAKNSSGSTIQRFSIAQFTEAVYTQKYITFTAPIGTVKFTVECWKNSSGGYIYADDLSLSTGSVTSSAPTNTATPTNTAVATATKTPTPVATATPTNTPVATATKTPTPVATPNATATPTPNSGGTNLIANPGFESGNTSWMGTGWGYVAGNQHSGSNAVRLGTGSGTWCSQDVTTNVVAGASYTFSAWNKCDSGQTCDISIQAKNSSGATIQRFSLAQFNGTAYNQKSITFTAPTGTVKFVVECWKNSTGGYSYSDDLSLIKN